MKRFLTTLAVLPSAARRVRAAVLFAVCLLACCLAASGQATSAQDRKLKSGSQPQYPELARKNNISGTTRFELVIAPDGTVKNIKILGGSPVLVQASMDALKQWKYEPGSESKLLVKFEFKPQM